MYTETKLATEGELITLEASRNLVSQQLERVLADNTGNPHGALYMCIIPGAQSAVVFTNLTPESQRELMQILLASEFIDTPYRRT